jgi:hypothetical protein
MHLSKTVKVHALWIDYCQSKERGSLRFGQYVCNRCSITDQKLFNEEDAVDAYNHITKHYQKEIQDV